MKKIIAITLLLLTISGLYLINRSTQPEATPPVLPQDFEITFAITTEGPAAVPQDLGTNIQLASLQDRTLVFTFDYLPGKYYTVIYLDGKPIRQPTQATLISRSFDLVKDQDSPFITKGPHTLKVMIYETKEQGLLNLAKGRLYQTSYHYEIS